MKIAALRSLMTFLVLFLSSSAFADFQKDLGRLVDEARKHEIVLIGEEHQNPQHAKTFIAFLKNLESKSPGLISVVGLEVYDVYQSTINKFLETGDKKILIETPDCEVIRGHRNSSAIKDNFLAIYNALYELNMKRPAENKIRVIAIDQKPDPSATWNEWKKKHPPEELIRWGAGRDPKMMEILTPAIQSAKASGKLSVVFVGAVISRRRAPWI